MSIGRIFVSAVVRRVAYVLVALLLAWCAPQLVPEARAGVFGCDSATQCDAGQALAACMSSPANAPAPNTAYKLVCEAGTSGSNGTYTSRFKNPSGVNISYPPYSGSIYLYRLVNTCATRPNYVGSPPISTAVGVIRNGSFTCMNGCTARWAGNGDGTFTATFTHGASGTCTATDLKEDCGGMAGVGMHWNAWIQACEPTPTACTGNQVKDPATGECKEACPVGMVVNPDGQCEPEADSCPAGQIKSPQGACLPGDGQCAAGEAKRPDGTCGKDSDGDGVADDDDDDPDNDSDKETFSGGESCDVPPSCSGSPVMCGQARIQWRIDCNTRKNRSVTGGGCNAMPVCTGKDCDAMEYSQLLLQWRATCALESGGTGGGGSGSDADIAAIKNALTGSSQGDAGGEGSPDDAFSSNDDEPEELDDTGLGFSRSCPTPPSVNVMGTTINFETGTFCSWLVLGGKFVLILAALLSLRIMTSGGEG